MYAPSLNYEVTAVLQSGYTPPSAPPTRVLSDAGPYVWRASNHDAVDAVLASGYTPPASPPTRVLDRPLAAGAELSPDGIASTSSFGSAALELSLRYLLPSGFTGSAFGAAALRNQTHVVAVSWYTGSCVLQSGYTPPTAPTPSILYGYGDFLRFGAVAITGPHTVATVGFSSSSFGNATAYLDDRLVAPGGIAPPPDTGPNEFRQIPEPWVSFWTRTLLPTGIAAPPFPTTHAVTHEVQFVDFAGNGLHTWSPGNARIDFVVRYIEPPFIASNIFGVHNIARMQYVTISGWESSFLSEDHQLDINLQHLTHHNGVSDPAEYGDTQVRNQREILRPWSIPAEDPGFPIVFNLTQQLLVQPYMDTNSDPTEWPDYSPFVENRNRVLGPSPWQSSRFSIIGNIIENKADPLYPAGFDATLWGSETFIAYRIRTLPFDGWDSFYSSQYTVVYNDARILAAAGWVSSALGVPTQVINLNRGVTQHSGWLGYEFGTAFIAYAIRTIGSGLFYDVPSGFPTVRLNPYPIAPAGIDSYRTGGHALAIHFNIVYAKSGNVFTNPRVGEPIVENHNKTLTVFPSDQSLYGQARVFNYNTHITITAGDLQVWGAHLIRDRTGRITVAPSAVPVFPVTHRARNVIPDPPAQQRVEPEGIFIGLESQPGIIPSPTFNYISVFPDGLSPGMFGTPELTTNAIKPGSIIDLAQVGEPTFLFTQFAYPYGVPWPRAGNPGSDGSIGESDLIAHETMPRLSPHTIYAPSSDQATAQARLNHPANNPHAIDAFVFVSDNRFGDPIISNYYREIGPVPVHGSPPYSSRFGNPALDLGLKYVYPYPIRSLRTGLPVLFNVPQYITFEWYGGWLSEEIPEPDVDHAVIRYMPSPAGLDATLWGGHNVELLNREVAPAGIPHRGNPQQDLTNPWGVPLVGYPRVYTIGGLDATLWSLVHRVEHRVRSVYPAGWDSFEDTQWRLSDWSDRMRVRRTNPPGGIVGIAPTNGVGVPGVSHYTRTVFGRGPSGYASGWHAVTATAAVAPFGWDSLEVGDIDEWEAGKIKPYGDDLSSMGTPRLIHPLYPAGVYDHAVGDPRVGSSLRLMGIPTIGFDGPSVTDEFGCNTRVVTPLPVLSQQVVSQPVMTL